MRWNNRSKPQRPAEQGRNQPQSFGAKPDSEQSPAPGKQVRPSSDDLTQDVNPMAVEVPMPKVESTSGVPEGRRNSPDTSNGDDTAAHPSDLASPTKSAGTLSEEEGRTLPSVLSRGMTIEGEVRSTGPLVIEGRIEGSVDCDELSVGPTGQIEGVIRSLNLQIEGQFEGEATCSALEMGARANFTGTLVCKSLVLASGATVSGEVMVG